MKCYHCGTTDNLCGFTIPYSEQLDICIDCFRNLLKRPKTFYISKRGQYIDKDKRRQYMNTYHRQQRKTNINYAIASRCRNRINIALKNVGYKSAHTLELIGCRIDKLQEHLQQTAINNGYVNFNINNYSGKEYHIDHIIPCSAFQLEKPNQQKLCFNYTNLQILDARTNMSKGGAKCYTI